MEEVMFYWDWLRLPKEEFRLLVMLVDCGGAFSGNLGEMCDYYHVTRQQRNREKFKTAIESLTKQGLIACDKRGNTWNLTIRPRAKGKTIPRKWLHSLKAHDYSSEDVAWEQVLKVYLWIVFNQNPVVTDKMIAADLAISPSTIGKAKNVLHREYEAITRRRISEKIDDDYYRNMGQELAAGAWWKEL